MTYTSSLSPGKQTRLRSWRVALAFCLCALSSRVAGDCPSPVWANIGNCTTQSHDNVTAAHTWGLLVLVGDQELCASPSTFTNHTFLPSASLCPGADTNETAAACVSRRGGGVSTSVPGSSFNATDSLDDLYRMNPNWVEIDRSLDGQTKPGNVTLQTIQTISLPKFPVGIITRGEQHNVAHLGLAEHSVFLQRTLREGFSFKAGSQSYTNPHEGHLIIGGYDSNSVMGSFRKYNISSSFPNRVCPLQVQIRKLELIRPNTDTVELVGEGAEIQACIEPYDNLFRFPSSILMNFMFRTGALNDTSLIRTDLRPIERGLLFGSDTFNGSLKFSLNNDFEVEIPNYELTWPLRGIAPNGTRVVQTNLTEVAVHNKEAYLETAVLGRVFLSSAYLAVDYRQKQFSLGRLAQNASTSSVVPFNCKVVGGPSSGLSPSVKLGLGLGLGLGIGILAVLAVVLKRKEIVHFLKRMCCSA